MNVTENKYFYLERNGDTLTLRMKSNVYANIAVFFIVAAVMFGILVYFEKIPVSTIEAVLPYVFVLLLCPVLLSSYPTKIVFEKMGTVNIFYPFRKCSYSSLKNVNLTLGRMGILFLTFLFNDKKGSVSIGPLANFFAKKNENNVMLLRTTAESILTFLGLRMDSYTEYEPQLFDTKKFFYFFVIIPILLLFVLLSVFYFF